MKPRLILRVRFPKLDDLIEADGYGYFEAWLFCRSKRCVRQRSDLPKMLLLTSPSRKANMM
jgi:hypothetical protein